MALQFDPYAMLGISEDASTEDIKRAYLQLVKRLHPDRNHNPGARVQLQDITTAHKLLVDPESKREYDQFRSRIVENRPVFSMSVTASMNTIAPLLEPQVMYLLVEITPAPRQGGSAVKTQPGRNLTLVLDHSNSMNGIRLEKVKVAAHQIINQLTEQDILSVVSFNDWANVIIPATPVRDKPALKARISLMEATGGTEMYKGLAAGLEQNRQFAGPKLINHIVLLTDGNTYGDEQRSLELAASAAREGIAISAMGLGSDWNDVFLDALAAATGGSSAYISSANAVVTFLNEHIRQMSDTFAERMQISIAPDPDVLLESAFKLTPNPQPLNAQEPMILLGSLQESQPLRMLFQLQVPGEMPLGERSIVRVMAFGDILGADHYTHQSLQDCTIVVNHNPPHDPPDSILNALSKLTLYRIQDKAQVALKKGDVQQATRSLKFLATRLLALGEEELAHQAMKEAQRVSNTHRLSDEGSKSLKFQTRMLLEATADSSSAGENNS